LHTTLLWWEQRCLVKLMA